MDGDTGGVLAAMTVGDRRSVFGHCAAPTGARDFPMCWWSAGCTFPSCAGIFSAFYCPTLAEQSYRRRRRRRCTKSLLALVLMGVTGFTPSVLPRRRGGMGQRTGRVGVGPASDALTSLAAAGILMTAGNSYAVCDIGFELSFAAVVGHGGGLCLHPPDAGRLRQALLDQSRGRTCKSRSAPVVQQIAEGGAGSCRECLHCRLRLGGYLPGAGAAGPECQRVGGGLQHRGAVDGAAAASAGPWHELCWDWCRGWHRCTGCCPARQTC